MNTLSVFIGILFAAGSLWLATIEWYRGSTERGLEEIRLLLDNWHREWLERP